MFRLLSKSEPFSHGRLQDLVLTLMISSIRLLAHRKGFRLTQGPGELRRQGCCDFADIAQLLVMLELERKGTLTSLAWTRDRWVS